MDEDPKELIDLAGIESYQDILKELEAEFRSIVNPESVDKKAKDSQNEKIISGGGIEAVLKKGSPGYTPAHIEEPEYK